MRKLAALTAVLGALVATMTTHLGTAAVAETGPGIIHNAVVVETPTRKMPFVKDGKVWAIVEWGDLVIVGGEFSNVRNPGGVDQPRSNIFAFNRNTGKVDQRFAPVINKPVRAIVVDPDGRGLFIGGVFNQVNGENRRGLVFLDRDGERVSNWAGRPNGSVFDLDIRDRELYVGGKFSRITGVNRTAFASVNIDNGQTTNESTIAFGDPRNAAYRGVLEIRRFEVSANGSRLVVVGNFQSVGGQVRDQVAVLDVGASPDTVANWSTNWFEGPCNGATTVWPYVVRDVSISPDSSYFAVVTVGGPRSEFPHPCDQITRFEMADQLGRSPTWVNYTGGDSVLSVEATGNAIYAGGHFRWVNNPQGQNFAGPGAIARGTLAALDPSTGNPFAWNPGRQPRGQGVLVMEASDDGLWIGHDTSYVNGRYSQRLTHFLLPGLAQLVAEAELEAEARAEAVPETTTTTVAAEPEPETTTTTVAAEPEPETTTTTVAAEPEPEVEEPPAEGDPATPEPEDPAEPAEPEAD